MTRNYHNVTRRCWCSSASEPSHRVARPATSQRPPRTPPRTKWRLLLFAFLSLSPNPYSILQLSLRILRNKAIVLCSQLRESRSDASSTERFEAGLLDHSSYEYTPTARELVALHEIGSKRTLCITTSGRAKIQQSHPKPSNATNDFPSRPSNPRILEPDLLLPSRRHHHIPSQPCQATSSSRSS